MKKNFISKKVFSLLAIGVLLTSYSFAQTNIVIEAEDADVFHFATISDRSGFSSTKGVDMRSANNGYVRYDVNVPTEGTYNIDIAYATMQIRLCYLRVNNQKPSLLVFDDFTTDWNISDKSKSVLVYLEAGNNILELGAYEYGTMQYAPVIDKLTITNSAETICQPTNRITPIVVEAESNNTSLKTGNATEVVAFNGFASGSGAKVGDGEQNRGSLTYENISVPEAGTYDITWYYASMQTRGLYIKVNNQKPIKSVMLETSNSWGDSTPADVAGENGENAHSSDAPRTLSKTEQIYLEAGNNTIVLASLSDPLADNGPNLDRFVIKSSPKIVAKKPELFKAYASDYTDIRIRTIESVATSDENLKRLFDNNENTFYASAVPVQIEIELPYPVIVQSYGLAVGESYDATNVTIERWHNENWLTISEATELRSPNNGQNDVTQPEVSTGAMREYTTWLGTNNKDRAGTKYRISFAGSNISVGEFQINGFPYAGPDDYYFPIDLTRDVNANLLGAWSWDQKGWGADTNTGIGSEGVVFLWDRQVGSRWTAESGKAYVEFNFNTATQINSYSIITREGAGDRGRNPRNWTLRGYTSDSDNTGVELDFQYGVDWNRLQETKSVDRNQNMIFVIANPGTYKRYRINFTQSLNSSGNVHAKEIQFLANVAPVDKYPTVVTLAASDIEDASAQLNSTLTTRADVIVEEGYKWRNKTTAGGWNVSTDGVLTSLTAATIYEFYAYAVTEEGHSFIGEVLEFITNTATSVSEAKKVAAKIYTQDKKIVVIPNVENAKIMVFNTIGQILYLDRVKDKFEITVSRGIYIVQVDGIMEKVIVE